VIRALSRAAAAAVLAAFAAAAWLAFFYNQGSTLHLDLDVAPPHSVVRGLYPEERDAGTGLTFAWTAETLTIALDDIDRQVDWRFDIRVRGARASGPNPTLELFVDGVRVMTHDTATDFEDLTVAIPARPAASGLTLAMRASPTFVPGPGDPRTLGVMLDHVTLAPAAIVVPPRAAFAGVAFGSAAMALAIALLGVTAASAIGGAVLVSAALAALVAHGFGPYTDYPSVVARAAMWTALATAAAAAVTGALRGPALRNTARFAIAFTAAAFLARLLVLLHPDMPIGDALFQAHRFQEVLAGRIYFTSIAPGNYQFPYAPGLYIASMPFAGLVRRGAADMTILRTVVCAADALAGLLLYSMAVRVRGDRLAGAFAVALYHLVPLGFGVAATGNLTNAFAQSLAVAAFALIAAPSLRWEHRAMVGLLAATLFASFVSHTSAFAIVSVSCAITAWIFWWRGGPALRSPAAAVIVAAIVAAVAAVVLYYAHFTDTYRTELARIGSETAAASPDAGGRGIGERLTAVPRYLHLYYGVPVLALAAAGIGLLWRRGARDRVTLSCAGWLAGCACFWALGILTPVDMRHYLAAIPAVAVLGAAGAAIAWTAGTPPRIAAGALLAWSVVAAVHAWWSTLT
jgi:hypothetical protein